MKIARNFHLHAAVVWLVVLLLYRRGWSNLNAPLDNRLLVFLITTIVTSSILALLHGIRPSLSTASRVPVPQESGGRAWLVTGCLLAGFFADFAFRGGIPLVSGGYTGFDVSVDVQATVGIPVVHVMLIAGGIFWALLLVDNYVSSRRRGLLVQFAVVLGLLLLNNSRGYIAFCVLGGLFVFASKVSRSVGRRRLLSFVICASVTLYLLLLGIGMFGNYRSGFGWTDASYISRIGLYNDRYPEALSPQLKWIYTYLTSPLANLNYNVAVFATDGTPGRTLLEFVPETFSKYAVARNAHVQYEVSYLNASTGYASAYFLGGGMAGLYIFYAVQVFLLELGAAVVRRLRAGEVLYGAAASVVCVSFAFYNSFSNTATCFLLPLAVCLAVVRHRRERRATAGLEFRQRRSVRTSRSAWLTHAEGGVV